MHIKVGQSSLTMKENGDITIEGNNIQTDGQGKITFKAGMDFTAEAMNAKIKANMGAELSGMTTKVSGTSTKVEATASLDLTSSGIAKLKGSINMIG